MSRYLNQAISSRRRMSRWRAAVVVTVAVPTTALGAAAGPAPGAAAGPPAGLTADAAADPFAGAAVQPAAGSTAGLAAADPLRGSGQQRDLVALRELRQRQDLAWERGDARAYAAVYTTDADLVTFNGDHMSTRAGIEEGMGYYFTTYLKGTRLSQQDERIRFPEPDLAVIVRTGCVLWPGETTCTEEALSVNTNVAVKRQGKWLYTSFQNTRIRPLRPTESPTAAATPPA